jgi:hypothetical protein
VAHFRTNTRTPRTDMKTRSGHVNRWYSSGGMRTRSGHVSYGYRRCRAKQANDKANGDIEEVELEVEAEVDSDADDVFFMVTHQPKIEQPPSIITVFPFLELLEQHIVSGTQEWNQIDIDASVDAAELSKERLVLRVFFGNKWSDAPFNTSSGLLLRIHIANGTVAVAHVHDMRLTISDTLQAIKIAIKNEFFPTNHFRAIEIGGAVALPDKKWADFAQDGVHTLENPLVVALRP